MTDPSHPSQPNSQGFFKQQHFHALGISPFLLMLSSLLVPLVHAKSPVRMYTAFFGEEQVFWEQPGGDTGSNNPNKDETTIGILPVVVRDYQESITCDSCHWLSPTGLRFIMENYLLELPSRVTSGLKVRMMVPHDDMVKGQKLPLLAVLDSLEFPWETYFYGFNHPLIYRPTDRMTPTPLKERLNRVGGALGMTHLLITGGLSMRVEPKRSNDHYGKISYSFYLVFWNVKLAKPEWALRYEEGPIKGDLDRPLTSFLDKGLLSRLIQLPGELKELREKEPR